MLYISSLGGGPEDGSVQTGGVFRLNLRTKRLVRIGEGFAGATDLAVTRNGRVFVTELFANRGPSSSTVAHDDWSVSHSRAPSRSPVAGCGSPPASSAGAPW